MSAPPKKEDITPPSGYVPSYHSEQPSAYSDAPVSTPAETPNSKAKMRERFLDRFPRHNEVKLKSKHSFMPNRPTSYGMAATLIPLAVSSALGITNPIHRTGAILLIVIVIYFVGLRTPSND